MAKKHFQVEVESYPPSEVTHHVNAGFFVGLTGKIVCQSERDGYVILHSPEGLFLEVRRSNLMELR